MKRILIILSAVMIIIGVAVFFYPKSQEVVVLDKIQKRTWFIPVIAEDNLTLIIHTDKGYFYVKGEFDTDGIRHIFKKLEPGKTYKLDYVGVRFDPLWIYPFISSFREIP